MFQISDDEIHAVEKLLLPDGCEFPEDARNVIRCWESKDVAACPGSGKTTVLLAKLKLLADRMPLDNGSGICVLSHTNVAVNEIKEKMADYAGKLMSYPNYIGTIQSFIDKFVTIPYLKRKLGKSVQPVDDRTYAEHLYRIVNSRKYSTLAGLVRNNYESASSHFKDKVDYIDALWLRNDGALCVRNRKNALAGSDRPSTQQYRSALQEMLTEEGLIKYTDAFQYAEEAVNELTSDYTDLFSSRFQYVFIDEYQDCNKMQRDALEKLFNSKRCCVFHVGDSDQAIYKSDNEEEHDWQPQEHCLSLEQSNRYGQEIADVLRPLRVSQQAITASHGYVGYRPVLLIYDMNTISSIKDEFVLQLDAHGLTDAKGIYKAIGHRRNNASKGITIGSYWDGFDSNRKNSSTFRYWSAIDEICNELNAGRIDHADQTLRNLICRIFHYSHIVNSKTNREYSLSTLKTILDEDCFDIYRESLLSMTEMKELSRATVSDAFEKLIESLRLQASLTQQDIMSGLPKHFMENPSTEIVREIDYNVYVEPYRGRRIQFDTIHGVKGETHDATLYLETEHKRSSDIVRILPYLDGKVGHTALYDYSRKLAYVGFSRPRYLLCLAVKESTFEKNKNVFQGWDILYTRKNT